MLSGFGVWLLCSFMGCGKTQPAISGTYVNSAGSAYSIAHDTLVVEREEGNHYLIHRRTGYRVIADTGKPGPWQYAREEWRAEMDESSRVMTERRNGKVISFSVDGRMMSVGKRKYERVLEK